MPRKSSPVSKDGLKSSWGGDEQLGKPLLERKPLQRGCHRSLARNAGAWPGSACCDALSRDFTAEAVTSVFPGEQRGGSALPQPHSPVPNSSQSEAPAPSKPSGDGGSVPAAPGPSHAAPGVPARTRGVLEPDEKRRPSPLGLWGHRGPCHEAGSIALWPAWDGSQGVASEGPSQAGSQVNRSVSGSAPATCCRQ